MFDCGGHTEYTLLNTISILSKSLIAWLLEHMLIIVLVARTSFLPIKSKHYYKILKVIFNQRSKHLIKMHDINIQYVYTTTLLLNVWRTNSDIFTWCIEFKCYKIFVDLCSVCKMNIQFPQITFCSASTAWDQLLENPIFKWKKCSKWREIKFFCSCIYRVFLLILNPRDFHPHK